MTQSPLRWSLSEFLNLIELRSQTWCFVGLGHASGFKIPHGDAIYLYALLEGAASLAGVAGQPVELRAGDIVMVLSGETHALRNQGGAATSTLDFLASGAYADAPADITVGGGDPATRLLAGRLKVRWPGGQHPRSVPPMLRANMKEGVVNFPTVLKKASGGGATAILTHAATLMFIDAFRDHPQSRAAFEDFDQQDPVARARQYIDTHPFNPWTVEILARKVGMGRSNFAMRFAREVGRPPREYIVDVRMEHAAIFLEKTNMKIAEIGERVGYRSEAAFIRRFTNRFGVSPGQLRKRNRRSADAPSAAPPGERSRPASAASGQP
jgi:AraC-like DNA-binding protein